MDKMGKIDGTKRKHSSITNCVDHYLPPKKKCKACLMMVTQNPMTLCQVSQRGDASSARDSVPELNGQAAIVPAADPSPSPSPSPCPSAADRLMRTIADIQPGRNVTESRPARVDGRRAGSAGVAFELFDDRLHQAVKYSHTHIIEQLLKDPSIDFDAKDFYCHSPLYLAIFGGMKPYFFS